MQDHAAEGQSEETHTHPADSTLTRDEESDVLATQKGSETEVVGPITDAMSKGHQGVTSHSCSPTQLIVHQLDWQAYCEETGFSNAQPRPPLDLLLVADVVGVAVPEAWQ